MKQGSFSRSAQKVAIPHQLFDQPRVLDDPLAVPITGAEAAVGAEEINPRYFKDRADGLRVRGGLEELMGAWV